MVTHIPILSFTLSVGNPVVHPLVHQPQHDRDNGYGILPPELLLLRLLPNVHKCFTSRGIATIKLDLRKQCRRNHVDTHCPPIKPGREQFILAMSTAIEMLIATRVFKLQIISTIAFSSSVASIGRGLDTIKPWDASLTEPTILDREFETLPEQLELVRLAKYFSTHRDENELDMFLNALYRRFPPECEWIHPLLSRFKEHSGKPVVVLLLQCPLRDKTLNSASHDPCFTEEFVMASEA
ncbi:hypothetical protein NM208_g11422 [Fusarium decemcellulare]|uniref:Uncharacterized protein n=1 Tax=Fusarium decemcellulare TaxID=57161 RepID=A0ACC1RSP4_9HYPO|nr:hypothetical protein NM208_g11422 [Fusarium decemcellulare]